MSKDLIPSSLWRWPRFPALWDEDWDLPTVFDSSASGISIFEDNEKVYIEAAVPGIDPEDIDVSYDKGTLWIKAEAKEEEKDKQKKYYRKAARAFSYRMAIPGNIDEAAEPHADYENGMIIVSFPKKAETKPKRLQIIKK